MTHPGCVHAGDKGRGQDPPLGPTGPEAWARPGEPGENASLAIFQRRGASLLPGDHSCSEWRSYSMGTIQGNKTQELRRGSGRVIPRSSNALVRLCGSSMFFVQIAAVVSRI